MTQRPTLFKVCLRIIDFLFVWDLLLSCQVPRSIVLHFSSKLAMTIMYIGLVLVELGIKKAKIDDS